jgi:hypothetical protein
VRVSQVIHAAFDFTLAYPEIVADWSAVSNTVVVLEAADELALGWLCDDVAAAGLRVIRVHEPDLAGALTAAAIEPAGQRLVRRLPLALRTRGEVKP